MNVNLVNGLLMKIHNYIFSAQTPNFKAFRIEEPQIVGMQNQEKLTPGQNQEHEFRGTERFLHKETVMIQKAKKELIEPSFPEPLEKIIEIIKRQEKNPFDLVLYAKEYADPHDDKIFLAIKDPEGKIIREREVFNAVDIIDTGAEKPKILSHFYTVLNIGEKLAERYSKQL